jgi:hypothetical protein
LRPRWAVASCTASVEFNRWFSEKLRSRNNAKGKETGGE